MGSRKVESCKVEDSSSLLMSFLFVTRDHLPNVTFCNPVDVVFSDLPANIELLHRPTHKLVLTYAS